MILHKGGSRALPTDTGRRSRGGGRRRSRRRGRRRSRTAPVYSK